MKFAQINENNEVIRVIIISDKDCLDENGFYSEEIATETCNRIHGFDEKITYKKIDNGNVGWKFDERYNAFIPPKPYPSWTFDSENLSWISPLGNRSGLTTTQLQNGYCGYFWDEDAYQLDNTQGWVLKNVNDF